MTTFSAWVIREGDDANTATLEDLELTALDDLPVTIRVSHSGLNYKDALALGGRPGVVRRFPLVAGIDLVGEVVESRDDRWRVGDIVTLDGAGLGEDRHGGLAGMARTGGDDLVAVPDAFSPAQAAAIGTAGFTAALAVLALQRCGLRAGEGPVLVTGASGGVGSIAIALLARAGHEVIAATGRVEQMRERLTALGASDLIDRAELEERGRPLGRQRWAAVVDGAGGQILASALSTLRADGVAAAYGLAASTDLPSSVLPFILRGVSLLGINSVHVTPERRRQAWDLLARDLDPTVLDSLTRTVALADARDAAAELLEGRGTGRTVVQIRS